MEVRPSINDTVLLHDAAGREYRSRVEALEGAVLTVARPLDLPAETDSEPRAEWFVTWGVAGGIAVLPTTHVATYVENHLGLWSLAVSGAGWIEQRREFVRVPAFGRVVLRPADEASEHGEVPGTLIDLSEGALRCSVDDTHAEDPTFDETVQACFRFGDGEFAVPGRVISRRAGEHRTGSLHLVVLFDEPNRDADALRKQIFALQRRTARPR